jgi:exodeoxyribonuclease VII small subunit
MLNEVKNMEESELTYSQAEEELEKIVEEMENEELDVDALSLKVKRAAVLLNYCSQRLRALQEDLEQIQIPAEN